MSNEVFTDNTNYQAPDDKPDKSLSKGFAITALILSIVNIVCCFFALTPLFATLAIIFAIISLATHRGGKGMAIAAIILAVIAYAIFIGIAVAYKEPIQDYAKFVGNAEHYVQLYDETHEVPEEFQKYNDPKYAKMWVDSGFKNFNEFYAQLIAQLKQNGVTGNGASSSSGGSGSDPVDLSFRVPAIDFAV